ncbi:hypothetical protein [Desulfuromonas acetoxidans]|uniref:hypothetical protein n=1 Tax=Desulfuromonas acetoxidans TaxID=891 RepID=UPI00292FE06B|nr:hypothetical protein [Desulfuromonas acetoxidans]
MFIYIVVILFFFFVILSYYKSKISAKDFVGETIRYFNLNRVTIIVEPLSRKEVVWCFKFSFPDAFDEDFYVYTNFFGEVILTNPKTLRDDLNFLEQSDPHPYSKEGREGKYK